MSTTQTEARGTERRCTLKLLGTLALFITILATLLYECSYDAALNRLSRTRWADDGGVNTLVRAIDEGQDDRVASLLRRGVVDVNGRDNADFTPLMRTASLHRSEACRLLIDHGADLNASTFSGWNALMLAAAASDEQVVRLLLSRGAGVDDRAPGGRTALMTACAGGDDRLAALLIEAGADVNAVADNGVTPIIDAAAASGWGAHGSTLVRRLVECGANVNAADHGGSTALMEASRWGSRETVEILLSSGADPHARDANGLDAAAHAATDPQRCEVAVLLRESNSGGAGGGRSAAGATAVGSDR